MPATTPPPPSPLLRTDQRRQQGTQPRGPNRFGISSAWIYVFLALLLLNIILTTVFASGKGNRITIPYTTFKQQVTADNVQSITVTGDVIDGQAKKAITAPGGGTSSTTFETIVPSFSSTGVGTPGDGLEALLEEHNVEVTGQEQSQNTLLTILLSFGPTLLLIGGFLWLSRAMARAGGGGVMGFGKSTARVIDADRPS